MATNTSPATAPTRPALRVDGACGAPGEGISGCSAAKLATTGGREGRVRLGCAVPLAVESNDEGEDPGATALTEAPVGGGGGIKAEEGDRGIGGMDGPASNTRRVAAGGSRVGGIVLRDRLGSGCAAIDCGEFDGSGLEGAGDGGTLVPPILRSTRRFALSGGWPESESCVDMYSPICTASMRPSREGVRRKGSFLPRPRICARDM